MSKRMRNVIVCVTDECNLSCKYCFASCNKRNIDVKDINEKFIKAIPLYVKVIKKACVENDYNKTQVIFHGGEPLLIKIENYEKLIMQLSEFDIDFVMQSNGTIMNEEIYNFLIRHGIRMGISLDGPKELHDSMRVTKNGDSSFDKVMNTIEYLKTRKYNFSCLATVTKNSLGKEKEIYDFFANNSLTFDFNPVFSVMNSDEQNYLIDEIQYAEFVIKLFDLWFSSSDNMMIVKFYNIIKSITRDKSITSKCDCSSNCSDFFVAVDNKGYIYNCSRFVGYENHKLSDVFCDEFSVSKGIPGIETRASRLEKSECKDCEIWDMCYGGCPYNALEKNGNIYSKDYFCEGKKKVYMHIAKELEQYKKG